MAKTKNLGKNVISKKALGRLASDFTDLQVSKKASDVLLADLNSTIDDLAGASKLEADKRLKAQNKKSKLTKVKAIDVVNARKVKL